MPATVVVNFLTVVHKSSTGIAMVFPDVCKTPCAPSPVPIPYPNIAMSSDALKTASTVKADGNPIMIKTSVYSMSTGDEAGSLLGVMSNKIKGSANPTMYSMDVKAEGKNVFRQLDVMLQNGNDKPINTATGPNNQPPNAATATGDDPEKYKIVSVKWNKTKCKCGDPVEIDTKTKNFDDGMVVPHTIRKTRKHIIDNTRGRTTGNKVNIKWISKHGKWSKAKTKLKAKATGKGGPKLSSNELDVEIPPDKEEKNRRVKRADHPWIRTLVPGGKGKNKYSWSRSHLYFGIDTKYDIRLKGGQFRVYKKLELVPKGNIPNFGRLKKRWRKDIESIWDRKWKLHRKQCRRGQRCNCPGGCCLFPINIKCAMVKGGAHKSINVHPGKGDPTKHGTDGWWNANNWFVDHSNSPQASAVRPHEFGHEIGMLDEYAGASFLKEFYDVPTSIMGRGTQVMKQHFTVHPTAATSIYKWFTDAVGEKYNLYKV